MLTKGCLTLLIVSLSLLACLADSVEARDEESNKLPDDWKEAHYQVYALEGEPLGHQKTLELLEQLHKLYQGREDSGSSRRRTKVGRLLEASKVSKDNCNREHVDKINDLIEYYDQYQINVVSYLNHYLDEQMKLCYPNWPEFSTLWRKMFNSKTVHYPDPTSVLEGLKELLSFLEKEPNNILEEKKHKIEAFIELSVIDKSKCNEETARRHRALFNRLNRGEWTHIEPYAVHFIESQAEFCHKNKGWRGFFSKLA